MTRTKWKLTMKQLKKALHSTGLAPLGLGDFTREQVDRHIGLLPGDQMNRVLRAAREASNE